MFIERREGSLVLTRRVAGQPLTLLVGELGSFWLLDGVTVRAVPRLRA